MMPVAEATGRRTMPRLMRASQTKFCSHSKRSHTQSYRYRVLFRARPKWKRHVTCSPICQTWGKTWLFLIRRIERKRGVTEEQKSTEFEETDAVLQPSLFPRGSQACRASTTLRRPASDRSQYLVTFNASVTAGKCSCAVRSNWVANVHVVIHWSRDPFLFSASSEPPLAVRT